LSIDFSAADALLHATVGRGRIVVHPLPGGKQKAAGADGRIVHGLYADLIKRDKINLDIFWLKDDTLDDPDLLPPPDEIAAEIVESLEAALEQFRKVAVSLQSTNGTAAE
jgi:hypothetical protein